MGTAASINKKENKFIIIKSKYIDKGKSDDKRNNIIAKSNNIIIDDNFSTISSTIGNNYNCKIQINNQKTKERINLNSINYNKKIEKNKSNDNNFFKAYISIKETIRLLNNFQIISFKAYLISTKTIQNFIYKINSLNIMEYVDNDNDHLCTLENKLENYLNNYVLEDNIKIIYKYEDCLNMIKNNKENEFIIVDELFCRKMNISDYYDEQKKIEVSLDKENSIYEIKLYTKQIINFKEIKTGFYKFIEKKNNILISDND